MQDLFAGENGGQYLTAILWTVGALVLLVVILFIVRALRRASLSFSGGDHAARPRLALGESIEVDNQRRLVLVRRDDVEHLILIGGPSDVLIEEGIGRVAAAERPQRREEPAAPAPAPRVVPVAATPAVRTAETAPAPMRPEPVAPTPIRAEPAIDTSRPVAEPAREMRPLEQQAVVASVPRPATVESLRASQAQRMAPAPTHELQPRPVVHSRGPEEDDVVVFPQEDALRARAHAAPHREGSLEDEMSRLLEDISDEKR